MSNGFPFWLILLVGTVVVLLIAGMVIAIVVSTTKRK